MDSRLMHRHNIQRDRCCEENRVGAGAGNEDVMRMWLSIPEWLKHGSRSSLMRVGSEAGGQFRQAVQCGR